MASAGRATSFQHLWVRRGARTRRTRAQCTARIRCASTTTTTVYAIGEGWTGALGTGRLDDVVSGHFDNDYYEEQGGTDMPVQMYQTTDKILSCAVGWAHTALVVQPKSDSLDDHHSNNQKKQNQLLLTGRPHEFSSLLRLQRQPSWLRRYAVDRAYRSSHPEHLSQDGSGSISLHPGDIIGGAITFMADIFIKEKHDWDQAREHSFLTTLTDIPIPEEEVEFDATAIAANSSQNNNNHSNNPVAVSCSAGITLVQCADGTLRAFGLNGMGQCGTGRDSNNVWTPTRVTGLSSEFAAAVPRHELPQSHPIRQAVLGLQHGLCLNSAGEVFSWGKGERGQLGHELGATDAKESHTAIPIQRTLLAVEDANGRPVYRALGKVSQVAAGMIHSAALEQDTNDVFVWGKNLLPLEKGSDEEKRGRKASDARLPMRVQGLPSHLKVLRIACGSHHTAVLLEDGSVWAVGVTTDTKAFWHTPTCLIEAGMIALPVTQFAAHMDRTTVVDANGQVLQVHLWEEEENRDYAIFTPPWVDELLDNSEPGTRIREVHRSWLHTVIVTERDE